MRPVFRHFVGLAAVVAAVFATVPASAQQIDRDHGRISFVGEDGLIKGAQDDEWSFASINSIVLPGDTVWADENGALELEFIGGAYVRLADGSKLDVVSLPPSSVFRAWNGSFYVQRMSQSSGDIAFETPVGTVQVQANSQVRIDVLPEGATTISVRWGTALVTVQGSQAVVVRDGHRTFVDPGYLPSDPQPFDRNQEDSFDAWNRERARLLAAGSQNVPIVDDAYDNAPLGVSDLNAYGDWIYEDDNYYWRPTAIREYVPYRSGYWSYVPSYGYTWCGSYPFSYITSHYGYWDYHNRHGWLWSYYPYYSPAYCATLNYGNYFVWSPINRYHNPVHFGFNYFSAGGFSFSFGVSSYCHSNYLLGGYYSPYYVNPFHHGVVNVNVTNVHIWNIFGDRYHHRYDDFYGGYSLASRDFSPRRVTRGPVTFDRGVDRRVDTNRAASRVARLQESSRDRFEVAETRNVRGERTALADRSRRAEVRDANVRRDAVRETSERARFATENSRTARELVERRGGASSTTITNADARPSDRVRTAREGEPGEERTSARTSVERADRAAGGRTPTDRSETPPDTRTADARTAPDQTRPVPDRSAVGRTRETAADTRSDQGQLGDRGQVADPGRSRTAVRTREASPAQDARTAPSRSRITTAPTERPTARTETPDRVTTTVDRQPRVQTDTQRPTARSTRAAIPDNSRFRAAGEPPTQGPDTSRAANLPRANTPPQRTAAQTNRSVQSPSTLRQAPEPRGTAPRESVRVAPRPSVQADRTRTFSAPARSIPPQSAPSQRFDRAPQPAPQQNVAPQRIAPQRSVAPPRQSVRQAPTRSAPSYSAPSRSSREFSAPSRSSSSRGLSSPSGSSSRGSFSAPSSGRSSSPRSDAGARSSIRGR